MGIQAYVAISDLEAANAKVKRIYRSVPAWDDNGEPDGTFTLREALVVLPTGKELWFHLCEDGQRVWIDANHWGNNRVTHLAPLEELFIHWDEY